MVRRLMVSEGRESAKKQSEIVKFKQKDKYAKTKRIQHKFNPIKFKKKNLQN